MKPTAKTPDRDDPPPEEIEFISISIDPVPYLKDLLARLPGIEQRFPGTDAELRPLVERNCPVYDDPYVPHECVAPT